MPVSRKHNCLFVHIPKTGGTSIETALGIFGDWRVEDRARLFGMIQSDDLIARKFTSNFLQHLTMLEIREILPDWQDLFSFCFVRNPWDRMVSIFANKDPDMLMQADAQGVPLAQLSFPEFVHRVGSVRHVHLLPQCRFVCDGNGELLVQFIGHFETLGKDFSNICERRGLSIQLPHLNPSKHNLYQEYYDDETREVVADRYQEDIQLFEYQFEGL